MIKDFILNESDISDNELPGLISIENFLFEIGIRENFIPPISEWWNENRKGISKQHQICKSCVE